MAKSKVEGRIRYEENWNGKGEFYLFEVKRKDETEWGLETAFPLKNDMVHYTALTTIRKWKDMDVDFYFGK